jgi:aryl-alcohol dehydrogenase-like predicted oxidoreductase
MNPFFHQVKIGLGTVQFGLNYGVSNSTGQVPENEVRKILRTAWDAGVRVLDTAAAYGTSEEILGRTIESDCQFNIVTKIPKIDVNYDQDGIAKFICQTFESSLKKLSRESVYSLMFHDANDLCLNNSDEAYNTLVKLKQRGQIKKIGVSAYTQEQLEKIRKRYDIDLVQVPFNIFDQRLAQSGYLRQLHDAGIEIHTRSTFLQGLILMSPKELKPFFNPIRPILQKFHDKAEKVGTTPLNLALTYVYNFDTISYIIVGVTNMNELREILSGYIDFSHFQVNDEKMINPSLWF